MQPSPQSISKNLHLPQLKLLYLLEKIWPFSPIRAPGNHHSTLSLCIWLWQGPPISGIIQEAYPCFLSFIVFQVAGPHRYIVFFINWGFVTTVPWVSLSAPFFPTAFIHLTPLSHFGDSHSITLFAYDHIQYLLQWSVIRDLWCYYCNWRCHRVHLNKRQI